MLDEQDFAEKGADKDTIITYLTSIYHTLNQTSSQNGNDQAKGIYFISNF